ncbi:MAG: hypothetical protein P8Y81_10060 [Ignavibacteriaceae bacterium]
MNSGEIAATAGTSGVIYGVTNKNIYDDDSRVNTFAHVNYSQDKPNNGVLLCINGTGIQYSWLKQNILDNRYSYNDMNKIASNVAIGSDGVMCFPFGNGAERIFEKQRYQRSLLWNQFQCTSSKSSRILNYAKDSKSNSV